MRILFVGIAGLNTDPESDILGLRPFLVAEAGKRLSCGTLFLSYSDPDLQAKIEVEAADYDIVVMVGHSFGGGAVIYLSERLKFRVAFVVLLDPAPNEDRFHQHYPWQVADIVSSSPARWTLGRRVDKALCFYQHNMQVLNLIGVCGVPIVERPGGQRNIDVTSWGLTHNDMVSDPRVLAVISYAFQQLIPSFPMQVKSGSVA